MGQSQGCSRCGNTPTEGDVTNGNDLRSEILKMKNDKLPELEQYVKRISSKIGDIRTPDVLEWDMIESRIQDLRERISEWENGKTMRGKRLFSEVGEFTKWLRLITEEIENSEFPHEFNIQIKRNIARKMQDFHCWDNYDEPKAIHPSLMSIRMSNVKSKDLEDISSLTHSSRSQSSSGKGSWKPKHRSTQDIFEYVDNTSSFLTNSEERSDLTVDFIH